MLLAKTDKARTAIQNRDAGLSAQERHILIVSNGQRSLNEIVSMLGHDTLAPIDRLLREGYLQGTAGHGGSAPRAQDAAASPGVGALLRASRDLANRVQERAQAVIDAATTPTPASTPASTSTLAEVVATLPPPPAPPRAGPRRSLAAARMYILDMLQLQRSVEAATLKVTIQASNGNDEVLAGLIQALRHLQAVATPSYYTRVATRLEEVLPEELVPRLASAMSTEVARYTAA